MLCFQFSFASFRFSLSLPRLTSRGIFPRMPGQISRSELKRIRLIGPTGLIFSLSSLLTFPSITGLLSPHFSSLFVLLSPHFSSLFVLSSPRFSLDCQRTFSSLSLKYRVHAHTHTGRVTILRETAHPAGPFFPFSDGKRAKKGGQNGQKRAKTKKIEKKSKKMRKKA